MGASALAKFVSLLIFCLHLPRVGLLAISGNLSLIETADQKNLVTGWLLGSVTRAHALLASHLAAHGDDGQLCRYVKKTVLALLPLVLGMREIWRGFITLNIWRIAFSQN